MARKLPFAAPVRLAVTLDQARAFGDLISELRVARRGFGHHAEPALDQLLLLGVAVAVGPQRPQPGERAHQQISRTRLKS